MKRIRTTFAAGALGATLLLVAPIAAQDGGQANEAIGRDPSIVNAPLAQGPGAGTITLPTTAETGRLLAVLDEEASQTRHILEAILTRFVPAGAEPGSFDAAPFGGIYGKLVEVRAGELPNFRGLFVSGTWRQLDRETGVVSMTVLHAPDVGTASALGRIEGKFVLSPNGTATSDLIATQDKASLVAFAAQTPHLATGTAASAGEKATKRPAALADEQAKDRLAALADALSRTAADSGVAGKSPLLHGELGLRFVLIDR